MGVIALDSGGRELKHWCHHYDVLLCFKAHAGVRLLAERPESCLVLAQAQIGSARRICDQGYTHTCDTLGITVRIEGRKDYQCCKSKREHYCLFPWMIRGHKAASVCACFNFSKSF